MEMKKAESSMHGGMELESEKAETSVHHGEIQLGAWAGIAAPVLFIALHNLQILLAGGAFSQIREPIGELSTQSMGWMQNVTMILCGALYILFAKGLSGALRPNLGPWLHSLAGLGVVMMGFIPWRIVSGGQPTEPIGHTIAAFTTILCAGAGLIALRGPMSDDRRWKGLDLLAAGAGVLLLATFAVYGGAAEAKDAPLRPWAGLFQRAMVTFWFFCTFMIALRMRTIAKDPGDSISPRS